MVDEGLLTPRSPADLGRAAARGSVWLAVVTLASKGAQVVVTLALALFLTPDQLGLVSVATVLINLGQVLQAMGVFDVIAKTRREPLPFAGTVAALSVGVGIGLTLTAELSAGWIAATLGVNAGSLIRVAALVFPFVAYGGVQRAVVQRDLNFRSRLWPDAGSAIAGASVTVVLAALGAGQWSVIIGLLVTAVAQPLIGLMVGIWVPFTWDKEAVRETLNWSFAVGPGAVLGLVVLNLDYIVIVRVLGEAQTGIYSLAYRIAFLPYITIAFTLGAVAFPVYSEIIRNHDERALAAAFQHFLHIVILAVGGPYILLALLADRLIILSPKWKPASPVLAILCAYGLLLSIELTCYVALRAVGRTRVYLAGQAVHVVLLFGALLALTEVSGIRGTAEAQVIVAGTVSTGVLVALVHGGTTTVRSIGLAAGRPLVATIITGAAGVALRRVPWLDHASSLVSTLVLAICIGSIYLLSVLVVDRELVLEGLATLRHRSAVSAAGED